MLHHMRVTASALRANIYKLLDRVIADGTPIIIERKGVRLKITREEPATRLSRLIRRDDVIRGDPADLVHLDWSDLWKP